MSYIAQTTQLTSSDPLPGMASVVLPVIVFIGIIVAAFVLLPKVRANEIAPQKLMASAGLLSLGVGASILIVSVSSADLRQVVLYGWILVAVAGMFGAAAWIYGSEKAKA